MKASVLQQLFKSIEEVESYAKRINLPNYENLPNMAVSLDDLQSLKNSLRNASSIRLDLWLAYLQGMQKQAIAGGASGKLDIAYLMSRLEQFHKSALGA